MDKKTLPDMFLKQNSNYIAKMWLSYDVIEEEYR